MPIIVITAPEDKDIALQALQQREQEYSSLVELSPDGIILISGKEVVFWNRRAHEIFGFDESEFKGKDIIHLLSGSMAGTLSEMSEAERQTVLGNLSRVASGDIAPHMYEVPIKNKNGKRVWIEINASPIEYKGKTVELCFLRDITERKQAQEALRHSEERFRALIELSSEGILLLNPDGSINYHSPSNERVSGYKDDDLVDLKGFDLVHPDDLMKAAHAFAELTKSSGNITSVECRIRHKDGSWRLVEVVGCNLLDNPAVRAVVLNYRDITERKKTEESLRRSQEKLQTKNKELRAARAQLSALNRSLEERVIERTAEVELLLKQKDEFIAQLGHDLKTPLTPLVGLLPLIEKREEDPQLRDMLGVAIDNVHYMRDLVIKTLELARLNTPGMDLTLDETNLLEQVKRVVDSRRLIIDEKNIKVRTRIDKGIFVKADKLRLQEVIDNLIANAVKYTPSGGSLTLDAKRKNGLVTVSVADNGIGMTQEQLSLVFNPFYKADPSRHDLQSSGLGLTICKRIVEKHGGLIWAESPGEGKGTTMYFSIPMV